MSSSSWSITGDVGSCEIPLRFGVYPNLVKALRLHSTFIADCAPGGVLHDPEIRTYYQKQIQPVKAYQDQMIEAAASIVAIMEAVERTASGTFGIELPQFEPLE